MDISRIFGYNIQNFRIKKFWIYPDFFWIYPEFSDMISRFFLDIYRIFLDTEDGIFEARVPYDGSPDSLPIESIPYQSNAFHSIPVQSSPSQSISVQDQSKASPKETRLRATSKSALQSEGKEGKQTRSFN